MACDRKTLLLISCYADGEATPQEAEIAARHLEECAQCRKLVEEWQGQRQMLEWACTFELPEEIKLEDRQVAVAHGTMSGPVWPRLRWNWRMAGVLATVAVIGLVGYWFATLPPILAVGETLASGGQPRTVRLQWGVSLRVGPDSKVTRVDNHSIKLERGWVAASVRHGTGLRVGTHRIQVLDQGTRFWVGTSPSFDCVTVQEGVVSVEQDGISKRVEEGATLIAASNEPPAVVPPLVLKPKEEDQGRLLYEPDEKFEPATADTLDFRDAARRMAARYPDARVGGGSGIGSGEDGTNRYRYDLQLVPGVRKALRDRFQEIAQALAGGTTDGDWETPVGYLFTYGIADRPELQGQAFYIRLVSTGGGLVWRLTGQKGPDADIPVVLADSDYDSLTRGSWSYGLLGDAFPFSTCRRDSPAAEALTLFLGDWPGRFKPALCLHAKTIPISEVRRHDEPMRLDVMRQTGRVSGLDVKDASPTVLYLDASREHRIMLIWNRVEAGKQIQLVRAELRRGRGGSVLMGIVATDVGWTQPALPAGVYLLWWTRPGTSQAPYWEVSTPDMSRRVRLRTMPPGLSADERRRYVQESFYLGPGSRFSTSFDDTNVDLVAGSADRSTFRFGFIARPNGENGKLGKGWIQIEKP